MVSALMLIASIIGIALEYTWFAGSACRLQQFIITWTLICSIITVLLSIAPFVQGGGILPASIVSLYCVYLCFSALSSDPSSCNTLIVDNSSPTSIVHMVLSLIIFILSLCRSAYTIATHDRLFSTDADADSSESTALKRKSLITDDSGLPINDEASERKQDTQKDNDAVDARDIESDEDSEVGESSIQSKAKAGQTFRFHLILALASMYMLMLLTNWSDRVSVEENSSLSNFQLSKQNMWIKIVAQWVTILVYIWSLIAPLVLRNRDFS
jgi:hypothetical protein